MAASLFERRSLTDRGRALLAKAQAGRCTIALTKAATGDGLWSSSESIARAEALKHQIQTFRFSGVEIPEGNSSAVQITVIISNAGLSSLYYLGEMGIFATDPDDGEILYAILTNSEPGQYIPSENGVGISQITERILLEVYNAANVTVNMNGAYASAADFAAARQTLNAIADALSGGEHGQILQKSGSGEYHFEWKKKKTWVYTRGRLNFPVTGEEDAVYIDSTNAAIYIWKNGEYFKLPLGADAAENLQEQITKNAEDIRALQEAAATITAAVEALQEKEKSVQVEVSSSGWTEANQSGTLVYTKTISVVEMPEDPDVKIYPGELIATTADGIEKENEACSAFFAYGRAYGEAGELVLKCWGDRPEAAFRLRIEGIGG